MTFDTAEASGAALLLAALRITPWLFLAPPFATSGLPKTVTVMLGVGLGAVVAPTLSTTTPAVTDTYAFLSSAVLQLVIGAALGFATRLVFAAAESAGGLLDLAGGFSLSTALDPLNRQSAPFLSRFYGMLATVLMLVTPAHQIVLLGFLRTFRALPLDATANWNRLAAELTHGASSLFVAALQIAGPLIVVLFLADIALGVLNRIAPQLNAFSLSFPLKIILTLSLVGLTFGLLPNVVRTLGEQVTGIFSAVT